MIRRNLLVLALSLAGMGLAGCGLTGDSGSEKQPPPAVQPVPAVPAVPTPPPAPTAATGQPNPFEAMGRAMAQNMAAGQGSGQAAGSGQVVDPGVAMAEAMKAMSQAMVGPDGKPVNVVHWEKLKEVLPAAPAGWTAGQSSGQTSAFGAIKASNVELGYEQGTRRVTVKITDSSFNPMALQIFQMAQLVQEESSEGYNKGVQIGGNLGIEEWKKQGGQAKLAVVVGQRFIVEVRGTDLADPTPVRTFFSAIDLARLMALKG